VSCSSLGQLLRAHTTTSLPLLAHSHSEARTKQVTAIILKAGRAGEVHVKNAFSSDAMGAATGSSLRLRKATKESFPVGFSRHLFGSVTRLACTLLSA
jgi:hypothetical protein